MNPTQQPTHIELHGRTFRLPTRPVVVVCVDGFDPDYLKAGCDDGILPTMSSWLKSGFHETAKCTMPSLTNANNAAIITGQPAAVNGVNGNYYLDKETGEEHMLLDDSTMWGSTILEQMADAGVRVAAITAKDKLRKLIQHGLSPSKGAICFSAQNVKDCTLAEHGITDVEEWLGIQAPPQYSGDLSIFVMDAGVKLLQENRADLFYLTLSDFIQHKYAPGSPESNDFLSKLDNRLHQLQKLGAMVAVTADHGMSDKSNHDGTPNVLFVEDFLNSKWPQSGARVMCPIADPFVKHHGALGGFVRAHLLGKSDPEMVKDMIGQCRKLPQVDMALSGKDAAAFLEMPLEREGDLVVISKKSAAVGSRQDEHDLSQLGDHRLRSHGGLSEQGVPLIRSTKVEEASQVKDRKWRNFDIFDLALNY